VESCWKCSDDERCEECDRQFLLKEASDAIARAKARLDRMDARLEAFREKIRRYKEESNGNNS
jgi:hypothetical protein